MKRLWSKFSPIPEFLIFSAKSLIKTENNVGERQSPCFTPLGQSK